MPDKSDGKMDEHGKTDEYANYWAAATDGSSQGSTVAQPSRSETSRSITPKGPLFPNLDEAHQAITSKLALRPSGNHIPEEATHIPKEKSPLSEEEYSIAEDSTASLLSARKMEFTKPSHPPLQRCLTPFLGTSSRNPEWNKKPANTDPVDSPLAPESPGADLILDDSSTSAREHPACSEPRTTETHIEKNDGQYHMQPLAAEPTRVADLHRARTQSSDLPMSNMALHRSASRILSANARSPEFRRVKTSIDPGKRLWELRHPTNGSPQGSMPELHHRRGASDHSAWEAQTSPLRFGRAYPSLHAVSGAGNGISVSREGRYDGMPATSRGTLTANHPSNLMVPQKASVGHGRPLPFPPRDGLLDPFCFHSSNSRGTARNTRLSTDSDDDPFKYDQGSFSAFLRPSREREVSAALRCVSEDSTVSSRALFGEVISSPEAAHAGVNHSTNPFVNGLRSYQTPTLEYDWDYEEDPSEFRIRVRSPPVASSSPAEPANGLSQLAEGPENWRRRQDVNTLLSEGPDWETVLDSAGQFDSNRAIASSSGPSCRSHSLQVAGSSIADCSDTSSVHAPEHDAFSSRERILQHPATDYTPGARNPRTLEDTGRPVFLPKPRLHRVNGYLHNSHRVHTDPTAGSSGNSTRSALVEKLSASIRTRSQRKRALRRLQQDPSRSKFESLGSISSEYSEESCESTEIRMAGRAHAGGPAAKPGTARPVRSAGHVYGGNHGHKVGSGLLASPFPKEPSRALLKGRYSPAKPRKANEDFGHRSPTLFNFPLISLEEAAQRAALNRDDNDDNLTVASGVRTWKNSSMDSSKATQRTTPPTPHLMKPVRTRSYRPSSASILGIPVADRGGYTRYSQELMAMGHDRGISNVTSYKSGTPLVPGRLAPSRASRTPFDYPMMGTSIRSSNRHGLRPVFRTPPCLVPRDRRPTTTTAAATAGRTSNTSSRRPRERSMANDLRQIVSMETGRYSNGPNPVGFLTTEESGYLSWEARRRREVFYYLMCALCVLPFTAALVYAGTADSALSWYTRGEVASLTRRQRRRVLLIGGIISVAWLCALVGFVVYLLAKRLSH
ncbi:hypothetical protein C8A05DRAFT_14280 [Staphylotrichum tortipilum]|uniref:Uncharacterized protein n=1 Tax=Staphylotrichum tortipilum TaxID=2831512 RepID=A0AAN6MMR9_9PEZI|nr:hypothetical protein C8A05DRAFT_14280 [Staphylotrichum longicolle]